MNLNEISTKELLSELLKREGVIYETAEPYENKNISVNGPAVLVTVID